MSFLQQIVQAKSFRKIVVLLFLLGSLLAWLGIWIHHYYYVSTDDAYLNANVVQITPRISGKVIRLNISNNQYVQKGELLFSIDPEPYQLAIDAAQAELKLSEAELENASATQQRTLSLVKKKFLSQQEGDNVIAHFKIAHARVEQAKANLAQAYLNKKYTNITAPTSGWVSSVTLRAGDIVSINQPLFALISDDEFWVDANFKETEMEAVKPGQQATITTDLYPHHPFKGVIESISSGSGTAFSLLPPQNATGNWVKVTQRIPVRIRVLDPTSQYPLRIGISATVTVSLR